MSVVVGGLRRNNLLVCLRDDCDEEVEQDNQVDELVDEPNPPDNIDHGELDSSRFLFILVGWYPWLIVWGCNITNRIPVALEEELHKDVEFRILEILSLWVVLNLKSCDKEQDSEEYDPQHHECGKRNYINYSEQHHLHQEPELLVNSYEVQDFEEGFDRDYQLAEHDYELLVLEVVFIHNQIVVEEYQEEVDPELRDVEIVPVVGPVAFPSSLANFNNFEKEEHNLWDQSNQVEPFSWVGAFVLNVSFGIVDRQHNCEDERDHEEERVKDQASLEPLLG